MKPVTVARSSELTKLTHLKDKLDLPRRRHTVDGLQRQVECLIQNIADCFLGRDGPPKDPESHYDVDGFDAIPIKIRDAVCPCTEWIPLRKNRCHFRNLHFVHVSSSRVLTNNIRNRNLSILISGKAECKKAAVLFLGQSRFFECGIATFEEEFLAHIVLPNSNLLDSP
jgi:hypothetical protein